MDKFRVISDLHIDVNRNFSAIKNKLQGFTVLAGDIGGEYSLVQNFLDRYIEKGVFVAGNHIVYNHEEKTLNELKKRYQEKYSINDNLTFLDADVNFMHKEVDGIIFIGTTLYTDYKYCNKSKASESDIKNNMFISERCLNDFLFGYISRNNFKCYLLPEDYARIFKYSLEKIKKIVEDNKDKDIVIITHHCPTSKCIISKYKNSPLNASFVSDLDDFILEHQNIKCWVCGHIHYPVNLKIGNCTIIANPYGYEFQKDETKNWNSEVFIDTKTWQKTN